MVLSVGLVTAASFVGSIVGFEKSTYKESDVVKVIVKAPIEGTGAVKYLQFH